MLSINFAEREQARMIMQEMADKNFNQHDAENLEGGATAPQNL